MSETPSAPAGWYPHPTMVDTQRYWDGQAWTDHIAPASPSSAPPAPTPAAGRPPVHLTARGRNGTVTFDGDWVTISRTGAIARMTIGKGEKRIPVSSIAAVQWKQPGALVNGFISFTVAGGNEKQSRFGSQTASAGQDENSVIVLKAQADAFLRLRAAIESEIAHRSRR